MNDNEMNNNYMNNNEMNDNEMNDNEINKENIIITSEQLEIGDIQIIFDDKLYVYERKTVSDLLSSINDGRYKEQKIRLLNSHATNIN
jgi:ERCC4-type nuclease